MPFFNKNKPEKEDRKDVRGEKVDSRRNYRAR